MMWLGLLIIGWGVLLMASTYADRHSYWADETHSPWVVPGALTGVLLVAYGIVYAVNETWRAYQ